MTLRTLALTVAFAAGLGPLLAARAGEARRPVVVELFTSEGCSSCPPADADLARLIAKQPIDGAEVIALAWHIDYWDRLGWKDRFASQQATARQNEYARQLGLSTVYTPQMVVDGRTEFVGGDKQAANDAITQAAKDEKAEMVIKIEPGDAKASAEAASGRIHVTVPKPPVLAKGDELELLIAVTEDDLVSKPNRGENARRTLDHTAVVRSSQFITGPAATNANIPLAISPTWNRAKLHIVAVLQSKQTRRVLAAARIALPAAVVSTADGAK